MKNTPTLSIRTMKHITKYEMARIAENLFRRVEHYRARSLLTILYNVYEDMPDRLVLRTPNSSYSIIEGDEYNKSLNTVQKVSLYLYDAIKQNNNPKKSNKRR